MCNRKGRIFPVIVPFLMIAGAAANAIAADEVVVDRDVPVPMRDGVKLKADIYTPKAEGKFPVLLLRTPYNKSGGEGDGRKAAARGYVAVFEDCRGRFASEGEYAPFTQEFADGYDTVEWAATLPKSDGRVVMWGGSYDGVTQLAAAVMHPPHLAGITPWVAPLNSYRSSTYNGGAFGLLTAQSWATIVAVDTLTRQIAARNFILKNSLQWARDLPLANYPVLDVPSAQSLAPYYQIWLQHPNYDDSWKSSTLDDRVQKLDVPVYLLGGWYDLFTAETLRSYELLKGRAVSGNARGGQRLIMGPWSHGNLGSRVGELDFGPQIKLNELETDLNWYDYLLKGANNGLEREKPIKLFVMGKNVWREEDDWPLARAQSVRYYLHSAGKANTLKGDGTLSTVSPQQEASDSFVYDPAEPVPTKGGALCCSFGAPGGPFDQRAVEGRQDVLVYTTPPFKEDYEVTGPVVAEVYASSSAVDTDFTAKLVDVWPNGYAQNLTDGIIRARHRNSFEKEELMQPGQVYKFTIDLWATSNVFLAGHRLRVDISSSNFPRFDRNLNTGEDQAKATRMLKATNSIFHDRDHPSAVVLQVVPR